ncbi:MAG: hypothetical protein BMS9Abin02_1066 [Anaerolineae bacterium]|nr:MAG: hypothetical protein BMS9Abin02_1066 [Anaerolineae bacterium]
MELPLYQRRHHMLCYLTKLGTKLYQIRLQCKEEFRYTQHRMITKRQLGIGFMGMSIFITVGAFAIDWWRSSNLQAFTPLIGPVQIAALAGAALLFFVGLTLLPLGDRPA